MTLHAGRIAGTIRLAFGGEVDATRVEHLAGDASVRSFHRVWLGGGGGAGEVPATAVLMRDPRPAADDGCGDDFVALERHLRHHGVGVPAVYARDRDAGLYLLEDLGDRVLQDEVKEAGAVRRRELYRAALEVLVVLARDASRLDPRPTPAHGRAFDEAKLGWEMEFFLTHTVQGLWQMKPTEGDLAALRAGFAGLVSALAALPRVFTHRDYHSRNLLVQGESSIRVVDFQDARMGPAVYDVASLLRDSYLDLDEDENASLLEEHRLRLLEAGIDVPGRDAFVGDYDRMSVQRGLKALGTFGYMATQRRKTGYLEAVPRTLARVRAALVRLPELDVLRTHLDPILGSNL
ncbi:MAG: phosphotransferase [Deltaproteobacteria bacterium]|nr:phosphotransferase [Deltaproteobacteria bacterium]